MTDRDVIDVLCRHVLGKPETRCGWQDVMKVRDTIDRLLNSQANCRQRQA